MDRHLPSGLQKLSELLKDWIVEFVDAAE